MSVSGWSLPKPNFPNIGPRRDGTTRLRCGVGFAFFVSPRGPLFRSSPLGPLMRFMASKDTFLSCSVLRCMVSRRTSFYGPWRVTGGDGFCFERSSLLSKKKKDSEVLVGRPVNAGERGKPTCSEVAEKRLPQGATCVPQSYPCAIFPIVGPSSSLSFSWRGIPSPKKKSTRKTLWKA